MMSFHHEHVLGLTGVCVDAGPVPYLVIPFMENRSLRSYLIDKRQSLVLSQDEDEEKVRHVFHMLLWQNALSVCHHTMEYVSWDNVPPPRDQT